MLPQSLVAPRTAGLSCSAIREILKVVSRPDMVSLAGGIPAPESFPLSIITELTQRVLDKYQSVALQYDCTEGFAPLREVLTDFLLQRGVKAAEEQILIASGSQGVLDAIGKVLIAPGDRVAVEAPTYLGALQAFNPYGPRYVRLATDDDGLIPESLEQALLQYSIKFVYLVPTFQNPTGRTLPEGRRKEIAGILQRHNVLLIEDDPYGALRYKGRPVLPIHHWAPDHVLYISTFSKILAPGLRVGFCVAPELVRKWLIIVKQGVDLHTSTFSQALAAEYLLGGYLDRHLPRICDLYRPRLKAMLDALERYFPKGFTWSRPEGGMFVWVRGWRHMDMETVYWAAVKRNTAFVPGKFFFAHPNEGLETMRLNFTMADETAIHHAIQILAEVITDMSPGASAEPSVLTSQRNN
jgi:2-aminoadipate transaminase